MHVRANMYIKRMILLKSKNLARYTDPKIILINYQNNYLERSNWLLEYKLKIKNFCSIIINALFIIIYVIQQNYFQLCI